MAEGNANGKRLFLLFQQKLIYGKHFSLGFHQGKYQTVPEIKDDFLQTSSCSFAFTTAERAKHVVSAQMEALSGLPSKEDWDLVFNGFSNTPFIKTSYPHQSGVWSWDDGADQVALAVQDIRQSMMEYSDTFWSMSDESDSNEIKSRGFHEGAMITDGEYLLLTHHVLTL